jgi:hypothetical protein
MKVARRTLARRSFVAVAVGLGLGLAACSAADSGNAADSGQASAAQDTAGAMSGMEGMPGMPGTGGSGMMEQMQAHLRMMDGAGPDSIQAMLPTHRQMVANMIAQFNKDMRGMNMPSDTAWTATVDSLRQDLTRMPEMSASELQQFMPAHGARVMRLMESHRTMMGSMRM